MLVFVFIYFFSTTEMPHKCTEPNLSYNKGIKARIEQKRLHQLYCIVFCFILFVAIFLQTGSKISTDSYEIMAFHVSET